MEQHTSSMSSQDDTDFRERLSRASEAKTAILEKFKRALDPDSPAAIEKRRQRELIAAARAEREAKREALRQEQERERAKASSVGRGGGGEAERLAAEERARQEAQHAVVEEALKVEQKAARDARVRRAQSRQEAAAQGPLRAELHRIVGPAAPQGFGVREPTNRCAAN